jgi:peptide chain release factor 1
MLDDPEHARDGRRRYRRLEQRLLDLDSELQLLLLPKDPRDEANLYLEVRAGTGGDEAAIFAGDLFRMYVRYAESRRWHVEMLSEHPASTAATRKSSRASKARARIRN